MSLPTAEEIATRLTAEVDSDEHLDDHEFVESASGEALALVTHKLTKGVDEDDEPVYYDVPADIVMRACLEVGRDIYYKRTARNGIVSFNSPDMQPMRVRNDPMAAAWPYLQPFIGPGIA